MQQPSHNFQQLQKQMNSKQVNTKLKQYLGPEWRLRLAIFVCVALYTFLQVISMSQHALHCMNGSGGNVHDAPTVEEQRNLQQESAAMAQIWNEASAVDVVTDDSGTSTKKKGQKKGNKRKKNQKMKKEAATKSDSEAVGDTPETTTETDTINNNDDGSTFQGTKITSMSSGVDLYEHVCLYRKTKSAIAEVWSYTNNPQFLGMRKKGQTKVTPKGMKHTAWSKYRVGQEAFMLETIGKPLDQWHQDVAQSGGHVFPDEVIWTQVLYNNPAHALTDVLFTLQLDRFHRSELANEREAQGLPFYPHYLAGRLRGFDEPPLHHKAKYKWLLGMLRVLNLVNVQEGMVAAHIPLSCFAKLLVPAIRIHRFPLSKAEDPEGVQNLFDFSEKREHEFVDPSLDYPTAALKDMQQRALIGLGLPNEPWPQEHDADTDKQILLHIRGKTQRRKLTNADELKTLLETKYRANVTVLSDAWLAYTFEKQSSTYNQYQYIITAHGAHLANGFFCRVGTKIVEIFCNKHHHDLNPDPTLTERGDASFKDWFGGSYAQWFETFTRRLGIDHFERGENHPERCGTAADGHFSDIDIHIPEALPLIVNRFGLVPR